MRKSVFRGLPLNSKKKKRELSIFQVARYLYIGARKRSSLFSSSFQISKRNGKDMVEAKKKKKNVNNPLTRPTKLSQLRRRSAPRSSKRQRETGTHIHTHTHTHKRHCDLSCVQKKKKNSMSSCNKKVFNSFSPSSTLPPRRASPCAPSRCGSGSARTATAAAGGSRRARCSRSKTSAWLC